MSNYWISIDPSKASTGIAVWSGRDLEEHFVIKPRGNKGKYYFGDEVVDSRRTAYKERLVELVEPKAVYIERGMGHFAAAVRAQGMMCGYIDSKFEDKWFINPVEVVVSEWRRVIKEDQGISWPADSKRCKQLSIDLTKELYGIDVCDDEADAILLGRACQRMFNIK